MEKIFYLKIKFCFFLEIVLSLPKSIFWNFYALPFKTAVRLPIIINFRTQVLIPRGSIKVSDKVKTFNIRINFKGSLGLNSNKKTYFIIQNNGKIHFESITHFSEGTSVRVNGGYIDFKGRFSSNKNCYISSEKYIQFSEDICLGWNITIIDHDGHSFKDNSGKGSIILGKNIWIGSGSYILKNVVLGDNIIIASNSLVTSSISKNKKNVANVVIGGGASKILKYEVIEDGFVSSFWKK